MKRSRIFLLVLMVVLMTLALPAIARADGSADDAAAVTTQVTAGGFTWDESVTATDPAPDGFTWDQAAPTESG